MTLEVHVPAPPLDRFIQHVIFYEGFNPAHAMDRFLPDGNTEFLIDLSDAPQSIYDNQTLAEVQTCRCAWVSGVRTRPITIPSGRGSRMLVVAFEKGKAGVFYALPMSEIADRVVDAVFIFGSAVLLLREQLLAATSPSQMFPLVERFLLKRAGGGLHPDTSSRCVEHAVACIIASPHELSLRELSRQIGYSQKHFIDLFRRQVGVTPKRFLRIARFQKAILEIGQDQPIRWSELALQGGFYDQAHFIRDFKALSGFTPEEYLQRRSPMPNYVPVG